MHENANKMHGIENQSNCEEIRGQFHKCFTCSFCAPGAKNHKKDSQFVSLFMLSGSAIEKAAPKYVGEIDPSLHNFRIMKEEYRMKRNRESALVCLRVWQEGLF